VSSSGDISGAGFYGSGLAVTGGITTGKSNAGTVYVQNSGTTNITLDPTTSSGLITAGKLNLSGDISCNSLYSGAQIYAQSSGTTYITLDPTTSSGLITAGKLYTTGDISCNGNITCTSSKNISGFANLSGTSITISGGDISCNGNMYPSGNLGAGGTVTGSNIGCYIKTGNGNYGSNSSGQITVFYSPYFPSNYQYATSCFTPNKTYNVCLLMTGATLFQVQIWNSDYNTTIASQTINLCWISTATA